jgi:hypothetical protein
LSKEGTMNGSNKLNTIDEGEEILRVHSKYGWNFVDYLYTPKEIQNLINGKHLLKNLKHCLRMFKN